MGKKIKKSDVIRKGKDFFNGDTYKFNLWLNTYNEELKCRPIDVYESKPELVYNELEKLK
jgi:hypothetical protein